MRRLHSGFYRAQVMHEHRLSRWSLTCDIDRLTGGPYAGWWRLRIFYGAVTLIDGSDVVRTKAEAVAAMKDSLRRGWFLGAHGWTLNSNEEEGDST